MKAVTKLIKRVKYAWHRHGWRLLGPLLWHNIVYQIDRLLGRRGRLDVTDLDSKIGIDTFKTEATTLMEIHGENQIRGHRYEPVTETAFHAALDLQLDLSQYTFIDYGSGKGRALLLATEYPFRRIIGVEYARELHEIAINNLAKSTNHLSGTERVECIWGDATKYEPPNDPLLCFLYNPFDSVILEALLNKLGQSLKTVPRDVLIAYVNPVYRETISRHPGITLLKERPSTSVFRLTP